MQGFLPIATAGLHPASILNCDLFIQHSGRAAAELYRGRTYPLEESDLSRLRQDGVDHLYIRLIDADAYHTYLCDHVLHSSDVPATVRVGAVREITRVAFQEAVARRGADRLVEVASGFGRDLASLVVDSSPTFGEVFKTLEHDYYTFTHVCNVSVYCALLARLLGMTDERELADLTTAAFLHDIGKRHIPPQVLNKTERLTEEEWDLIREHPTTGFRDLARRGDLSWPQLMMVYQHHERLDGTGYPTSVAADEIHPWAKVCAVADVFDALTCHRPYRRPMPLDDVLKHLQQRCGSCFDPDIVQCWTTHIKQKST